MGGGFALTAPDTATMVTASQFAATGEAWTASLTKPGSGSAVTTKITAFAICA
jgi:hypothetical protein